MADYGNTEAEIVRSLVRRVDKNLTYDVRPAGDAEAVLLTLQQGKLSTELRVPIASIAASRNNLMDREQLRLRIKRARDTMWACVGQVPLRSNRIERSSPTEGSFFFRPSGGQRGRR